MFCFTSKSVASLLDLILPSIRISSTTVGVRPTPCTVPLNAHQNSTLLYTVKMDPIDAAFAALELQDPPNYTQTAK
jgi:hypothetical protein